ncbi:MAG: TraR/DksA family transcriptional regulator [Chitinophagaceae bacterium]
MVKKAVKKATPTKKVATKKDTFKKVVATKVKKSESKKIILPKKDKGEEKKVLVIKKPIKKPKSDISKVRIPKTSTKEKIPYNPDFESTFLSKENTLNNMNNNIIASVRYSDADLEKFKQVILAKIDRSKAELAYLQNLIKNKEDISQKAFVNADDGIAVQEHEQLVQMAGRQVEFIKKLEEALIRIENKTYGICRVIGKLIDKKRLLAVPHATLSMEAKTSRKDKDN